jgi:hypothetical protein
MLFGGTKVKTLRYSTEVKKPPNQRVDLTTGRVIRIGSVTTKLQQSGPVTPAIVCYLATAIFGGLLCSNYSVIFDSGKPSTQIPCIYDGNPSCIQRSNIDGGTIVDKLYFSLNCGNPFTKASCNYDGTPIPLSITSIDGGNQSVGYDYFISSGNPSTLSTLIYDGDINDTVIPFKDHLDGGNSRQTYSSSIGGGIPSTIPTIIYDGNLLPIIRKCGEYSYLSSFDGNVITYDYSAIIDGGNSKTIPDYFYDGNPRLLPLNAIDGGIPLTIPQYFIGSGNPSTKSTFTYDGNVPYILHYPADINHLSNFYNELPLPVNVLDGGVLNFMYNNFIECGNSLTSTTFTYDGNIPLTKCFPPFKEPTEFLFDGGTIKSSYAYYANGGLPSNKSVIQYDGNLVENVILPNLFFMDGGYITNGYKEYIDGSVASSYTLGTCEGKSGDFKTQVGEFMDGGSMLTSYAYYLDFDTPFSSFSYDCNPVVSNKHYMSTNVDGGIILTNYEIFFEGGNPRTLAGYVYQG